ncbi:hypothetical protein F4827_003105 [Paraburkholderia bannensis]|uniref:KilA-N DNA-binding domain-containing protein n=1 Tax=Paraburkholderia bannensis TaxID=765414 RepID=A0A7W9TZJ9_9BURK|nr:MULTISPECIES: ORF6N domain-containing protein [Paraburkholderia]MBB3258237.1 hypothetical protein [Paraburkholderia sp. WP4_3_2]MBB6103250.1 hypothetical protein [Paraburkholderia bannensis]
MEDDRKVTPETLPAIVWREASVITTELLAKLYQTDEARIRQNFMRNAARFEEGKHYFRLEGDDLRSFKALSISKILSRNTRSLILWTERGAARHAKMIETDKAWDVFEKLEDCYFRPREPRFDAIDEISSSLERLPLYLGVARMVIIRRLMFSTAYTNVSLRVGVLHFRDMTKRNVLIADGFIRRVEAGTATAEDFRTIQHNRNRLLGPDAQLKLIED